MRTNTASNRSNWLLASLLVCFTATSLVRAIPAPAGAPPAAEVRTLPDFSAVDVYGQPFEASSLRGKIVLLDFWAVWCAPCIRAFPILQQLHEDLKDSNFQVLGVAAFSGTADDIRPLVQQYKLEYTVIVADEDLVEQFNVIGFPTYFLFDAQGRLYKKYVGEVADLAQRISADVATLRAQAGTK